MIVNILAANVAATAALTASNAALHTAVLARRRGHLTDLTDMPSEGVGVVSGLVINNRRSGIVVRGGRRPTMTLAEYDARRAAFRS